MVSERLGISPHTVYAELGVLQQTLFTRAFKAIARGEASVVLICGGEARARMASAARAGLTIDAEPEAKSPADTVLSPAQQVISRLEIDRQLYVAARQYAIIETALRAAAGQSIDEHAREVATLWDEFAAIAATRARGLEARRHTARRREGDAEEPLVLLAVHQAARLVLDGRPGRRFHPVLGRSGRGARESPVNIGFSRMRPSNPTP